MKKHKIFTTVFSIVSALIISSCETIDLDKTQDPFNLTPDKASVEFLFNSIEEDFARQIEGDADYSANDNWQSGGSTNGDGLSLFGGELTRMYAMSNTNANNYRTVYQPSDSDDEWVNFYAGLLPNIRLMNELAIKEGKLKHIAIGQFIEAYLMTVMVDFYGDIPYSQANLGSENFNPTVDSGASIYAKAIELLDDAIVKFGSDAPNPTIEVFYDGNTTNWIKAANTLKMRLYVQTRNVDNTAITKFNDIVASGNYIQTSAEDLVYNWSGTSITNPDSRHPRYGLNYGPTGAGDYMSNWLMNTMSNLNDPRIRYYFYRQRAAVPGQEIPADEQTLSCSLQTAPAHYIAGGFTFCNLPNGFWGRDHGDVAGTPPDGFLRTTFGVYPAGGRFDGDNFENISATAGAKGKGITPILLASWVDFMKAEIALAQANTGLAKTEMLNGINKSIAKVMTFGINDPTLNASFVPTATAISNYISNIGDTWDNAPTMTDKWNVLAVQQFLANFGNGIETYNYYRRTGYPTSLQPNRDANPGGFVRSMYYPSVSVNNNQNISQKASQTIPVFWDTNPSPIAN